jgi:uncharacterized protein YbaR (Trm112 family)
MSDQNSSPKIAPDLLAILCCPETHQKLRQADVALIEKVNGQISAGALRNRAGKPVAETIDAGLVREDGKCLYPIRRNLPILLADEAIPI